MFHGYYDELVEIRSKELPRNAGNCKRCMYKSHCGNKNKKESTYCTKYRPEIKIKRGKRR